MKAIPKREICIYLVYVVNVFFVTACSVREYIYIYAGCIASVRCGCGVHRMATQVKPLL